VLKIFDDYMIMKVISISLKNWTNGVKSLVKLLPGVYVY